MCLIRYSRKKLQFKYSDEYGMDGLQVNQSLIIKI